MQTGLMARLGLSQPIIQAPLAGGGDTPALVAAVSDAGGLGFIGAAYLTPDEIGAAAREVRARTARPFGVNLFAPEAQDLRAVDPAPALERLAPYYAALGLPLPAAPQGAPFSFQDQLGAVLESGAAAFSFTFGLLPHEAVSAIKAKGMALLGTATTVGEAVALAQSGVDGIIAQGAEAGGHRGSFAQEAAPALIGTMALVPQIVDAVALPVIAAGGIMDGRGIVAALALGAEAAQMGTAFLACAESGIPEVYRCALRKARAEDTGITRAFSGRPARGIVNRFMREMSGPILPFPYQNEATRPLRAAAAREGRAEFLSLWAGQGAALARYEPARALMSRLAGEVEGLLARWRTL